MLGRGVAGAAVVDLHRRDRRDGDDQPVAGVDQLGQQRAGDPQRAQHIGLPHPAPMLEISIGHRRQALGAAGVVDQHVYPAQLSGQRLHGRVVSDVGHNRRPADLGGQRVDPVGPARHRDHMEPLRRKGSRGRLADTRAGSGDDGNGLAGVRVVRCRRMRIRGTHLNDSSNRAKFLVCTPAPCSAVYPRVVARAARVVAAQPAAPELSAKALATVCGYRPPSELGQGHTNAFNNFHLTSAQSPRGRPAARSRTSPRGGALATAL